MGGYGVFGERLARLLTRDGHQVTVAGRDLRAAERLGRDMALRVGGARVLDVPWLYAG